MKTLIIAGAMGVVGAGLWGYNMGSMMPILQNDTTYKAQIVQAKNVCDQAHNEINGESEEKCGRLQEVTNTQYSCNQTGSYCWLEVR